MGRRRRAKIKGWLFSIVAVMLLLGTIIAIPNPSAEKQVYGVSFSAPHARGIGLDWQEAYQAILTDLGVKRLRLSAYWNDIAPEEGLFNFEELDYQMDQAAEHDAEVILAIGRKLPRWPECHAPEWVKQYPKAEQDQFQLDMLATVVERYKDHPALRMWQLENEPLLDFGICPPEDLALLETEQLLVRSFDPNHPIMITDSGELNSWIPASQYGDILGTTMYRTVFSGRTQKLFHYDYIFPSWIYRAKARLVKIVNGNDVLISELQGEPWGVAPFPDMTVEQRRESFSPERFSQLQRFAARTQLPEAYWWGVEYWYWEKEVKDEPVFWEMSKSLFAENE